MKSVIVFVLAAIGLSLSLFTSVKAANPADLTGDFRLCPVKFYKFAYDGGPFYFVGYQPLGKNSTFMLENWNSKGCATREYEMSFTERLAKGIDVALVRNLFNGDITDDKWSGVLDLSNKTGGLGVIFPLQSGGEVSFGPRLKFGRGFTAFLTTAKKSHPLEGVSYINKHFEFDAAYGCNSLWWFRVSKIDGKVIPEIRLRFTKEENFLGFGLAYHP